MGYYYYVIIAVTLTVLALIAVGVLIHMHRKAVTIDINKPPPGIFVEHPEAIKVHPGEKWPDPAGQGLGGYILVTSLCGRGTNKNLVNGGLVKGTNKTNSAWTACIQINKPYPGQ